MLSDARVRESGCNIAKGVTCGPILRSSLMVPWGISRFGKLNDREAAAKQQNLGSIVTCRLYVYSYCVPLYLVPNLDLVRVLSDVGVYGLFDQVALAACNPQDQVVKRAATQDIHVVAGARPAARAEAIRLVSHLYNFYRDLRWVVARHAPPAIAHVAR
jgi:hypothetical protein